MTPFEQQAWDELVQLGAKQVDFAGQPSLDVSAIRIRSQRNMARFVEAFLMVVGRGKYRENSRHMDREDRRVFVISQKTKS